MPVRLTGRAVCSLCPLHEKAKTVCIGPDGHEHPAVVFVGEAPGAQEDDEGRPFVGRSGQLLRDAVARELPGIDVTFTNTVRCRPPDNRTPLPKEQTICSEAHLLPELRRMRPALVVAVGAVPLNKLTGQRGILKLAGSVVPGPDGLKVLALPHPAYVLRNPGYERTFRSIVRGVGALLSPDTLPLSYRRLSDPADVTSLLARLARSHEPIAFDYETDSLDPWAGKVKSVALSDEKGQAYCFDPELHRQAWTDWLLSDVPKVVHNLHFEGAWSLVHYHVFPVNVVWDTQLGSKIEDENEPSGLKAAARRDTDMPEWASGAVLDIEDEAKWSARTIEDLWEYNCGDADATLRLCAVQSESDHVRDLMPPSLEQVTECVAMRVRGVRVDLEALDALKLQVRASIKEIEAKMREYGTFRMIEDRLGKDWNRNSPAHVQALVFDGVGLPPTVLSRKTKKPGCPKEFLEANRHAHPLIEHLVELKQMEAVRKNFIRQVERLHHGGILHPVWWVGGTKTWRLATRSPSFQNIPKHTDVGKRMRRVIVPPPGHVLVELDYSQIELRVLAAMSREEALLDAFTLGQDVHAATAARMYGVPIREISTDQRAKGKRLNFGVVYGISEHGLAAKFGIPEHEGRDLLKRYWETMPRVATWMEDQRRQAWELGYVESMYGRRRHLPDIRSERKEERAHAERQAGNFPVQSTAAEITLRAIVAMEGLPIVAQVHDSVLLQAPEKYAEEIARVARDLMVQVAEEKLGVPVVVDVERGYNWGEMENPEHAE